MTPHDDNEIFLHPGEIWFGDDKARVRTILGSCVAVTLWHPLHRIGGMCHYMLPHGSEERPSKDGRYAEEAVDILRERIAKYGTRPNEYEAKLFGGGNMFPNYLHQGRAVPDRNIAAARELMARYGFCIKAEHMGGRGHRSIIFEIANGDVWVRQTPLIPETQMLAPGKRQ